MVSEVDPLNAEPMRMNFFEDHAELQMRQCGERLLLPLSELDRAIPDEKNQLPWHLLFVNDQRINSKTQWLDPSFSSFILSSEQDDFQ